MTVLEHDEPATAPRHSPQRRILACGSLAVVLGLAACGGSAKPSPNKAPAGSAGSSAAATATTSAPRASGSAPGSGSANASPGGAFCSLVTADEAQAVVGEPLAPGLSRAGAAGAGLSGSCLYKPGTPVLAKPTVVNVIVLGTKFPRAVYDSQLKGNPNATDIKPLAGLGEDAFYVPGVVTVFDHGVVIALEIIKDGRPVDTATIAALLRKALGRAGSLG